jgi:hypothetical protein
MENKSEGPTPGSKHSGNEDSTGRTPQCCNPKVPREPTPSTPWYQEVSARVTANRKKNKMRLEGKAPAFRASPPHGKTTHSDQISHLGLYVLRFYPIDQLNTSNNKSRPTVKCRLCQRFLTQNVYFLYFFLSVQVQV